jgi:hypothetical protein
MQRNQIDKYLLFKLKLVKQVVNFRPNVKPNRESFRLGTSTDIILDPPLPNVTIAKQR